MWPHEQGTRTLIIFVGFKSSHKRIPSDNLLAVRHMSTLRNVWKTDAPLILGT